MSNLEYVLKLNDIAREVLGRAYYRVAPWVIDFTAFPLREASASSAADAHAVRQRQSGH